MKKMATVSIVSLLLTSFPIATSVAATSISGSKCSKNGSIKMQGKVKFSCTKSGKKLLWKKSTIKVLTDPKSDKFPIPIKFPITAGQITFSNILDNVDKVAQVAYENVHKTLESNIAPTGIEAKIWVGPNTSPVGTLSEQDRFAVAMKLWSGFQQPKTLGAFLFNTQDEPQAEIEYQKWRTENNIMGGPPPSMLRNDCLSNNGPSAPVDSHDPLQDCTGANATVIDSKGTGLGLFGIPNEPGPRSDPYRLGAIEMHEYTHMVQTAQFVGGSNNPGWGMQSVSPCWLQEGQAHFASKTASSSAFNDYLRQRNGEAQERRNEEGNTPPRDFASISKYLTLATLATCKNTYSWGYATGMLAVEALSAIGGVQSTMALYTLEARGLSFAEAFKAVYGVTWDEAQPILAKAIEKSYSVPSMQVQ